MKFSIILPSLLSDYPGSAMGKDKKLIRSIDSVLSQLFTDFELIVISDGCTLTEYLVNRYFTDERIKLVKVERKELWSNTPRNAGIDIAKGEYIIYIDGDDRWGPNHLQIIKDQLKGEDWVYFNDWRWNGTEFIERQIDITQYGYCGTSNICHAARLNLRWEKTGYGHDFHFIQQLSKFEGKKISTPEYFVCHEI